MISITSDMNNPQNMRVLYLEDDEDSRDLVRFTLRLSGFDVETAITVEEAEQMARDREFDLFLLDGLLPCGNSLELCRTLHRLDPVKPVVFYSALGFAADVRKGLDAGASAYLVKPYSGDLPETLLKIIDIAKSNLSLDINGAA
jgi:DNA-binding response OmpR family regulator